MTGFFKTNSPVNIILLLVYSFVLKWHSFVYPHIPQPQPTDGFLYFKLLSFLSPAGQVVPVIYPLIVLVLTLTQAVIFNNLVNNEKLLPKPNYLPAMAYLLITSLFPEWWQLSSAVIINSLLVWIWAMLSRLFNHPRPKTQVFNAGLVVGLASFLYFPAIGFSLLVFFALITLRPFHLGEWLVALLGLLTPYYFLFAFLFLNDTWNPLTYLPSVSVSFPAFLQDVWAWVAIILLMVPFLISGFYIQSNILRMLIQVRKTWSLMLFYLLIALLIPFVNFSSTFAYWILCALPFAAFHGYTFFYAPKKWLPVTLHWVMVAFILALNIWVSVSGG
ncbi:MAG: hypothetical protein M9904_07595 [Chitinophagaceae bacterium]|nr:hypothetical protein [Chitinophagaceae bacterium]